jgi:hypothetical protein
MIEPPRPQNPGPRIRQLFSIIDDPALPRWEKLQRTTKQVEAAPPRRNRRYVKELLAYQEQQATAEAEGWVSKATAALRRAR